MGKPSVQTYLLSASSACVAESSTFPFDLTKTRLQAYGEAKQLAVLEGRPPLPYRGLMATIVHIVKSEGVPGLYRGLPPACLRHTMYTGSRVVIYEFLRDNLFGYQAGEQMAIWQAVACGMSAGAIGQFIASPTDLVKVQLQLEGMRTSAGLPPRFRGTADAFRVLFRQGGVPGMWRGWLPNVQRAMLVQIGDLATYDLAKQYWKHQQGVSEGPALHAVASATSGIVAATLGSPADLIKTRFMNQPVDEHGRGTLYRGTWDCVCKTVRSEGVPSLWKGWLPTWMRMGPWSLVFWMTFEQLSLVTGAKVF